MGTRQRFVLDGKAQGLKLDQVLERLVPQLSKARLQKLVRRGCVRVDGQTITRSNGRMRAGAHLEVELEQAAPPLALLHGDDQLLVVDKPAGLLTHGLRGKPEQSLADLADGEYGPLPTGAGDLRPGIVHRLDRDTSGVIVLARTDAALTELKRQFREHLVSKRYLALCVGRPPGMEWEVDRELGPSPEGGDRQWVEPPVGGRPAQTRFRQLDHWGELCWIEARPRSGRTHQIRLHLLASGLSVVDDPLYRVKGQGKPPAATRVGRCALHATSIELDHPNGGARVSFEAPLPADLAAVLAGLG